MNRPQTGAEEDARDEQIAALRQHERTGRPLGSPAFVRALEGLLACPLMRGKPGTKSQSRAATAPLLGLER